MNLVEVMRERADRMVQYAVLRAENPNVPAATVFAYVKGADGSETFSEWNCRHEWAYMGDDDARGRSYCLRCGKDGDA